MINQRAIIICLIQHFEADFLWKVSLKILNSGIILKTFTHGDIRVKPTVALLCCSFIAVAIVSKLSSFTGCPLLVLLSGLSPLMKLHRSEVIVFADLWCRPPDWCLCHLKRRNISFTFWSDPRVLPITLKNKNCCKFFHSAIMQWYFSNMLHA